MIGILLALAVLILPLQWFFAILLAAAFHELCHYWAVCACGGRVIRLDIGLSGARMDVCGLSRKQEFICALAGPFGGLSLLFLVKWIPRVALCAGCQSLFNLMPIYPLDGGRALRCGLELLWPGRAEEICIWIQRVFSFGMVLLLLYGGLALRLGAVPLIIAGVIFGKIACKPGAY